MTLVRSAIVLAIARVAVAEPTAELSAEFQSGVDAYRLGHLDEAKRHLAKARDLDPKLPGPHRFLGAVAQGQGRWQDCIDETRTALELNPRSSEAPDTRKLHDECRASAGRAPYRGELGDSAAISVTTSVPGATVKIGGLTYGSTPLAPRPITAGALEIDVAKPGWKPAHAIAHALPGIVTDVTLELEADPSAGSAELRVAATETPNAGWLLLARGAGRLAIDGAEVAQTSDRIELSPGPHAIEVRRPGADPWRQRVRIIAGQSMQVVPDFVDTAKREAKERRGLAILGGAAVLAGVGFAAALASEHAADQARDIVRVETARDPTQPLATTGAIEPVRTRADFEAARSRASHWAIASDIAYAAALAAAGVGAYYLYIAPVPGGAVVGKEVAW